MNPTMRIGNCFEDGKPAKGFVRMVRYGQRRLGEYSYNVFDPSVETGIGERKTVDEAAPHQVGVDPHVRAAHRPARDDGR